MYGDMFEGMAKLALVGAVAIMVMIPVSIAGAIWALWWAWNHVTIH